MPSIASIAQTGGEYAITVIKGDGETLVLTYPADPPDDHTPESWLATCCREALLLADAQTQAAAEQPVDVAIPAEFTAGGVEDVRRRSLLGLSR